MIKEVKITNSYGNSIILILNNPVTSGYAITGISGLEPPQVDIKQTQMVSGLKYRYNFGFHKYREITINIIYYEANSAGSGGSRLDINDLRTRLISYIKTNDEIVFDIKKTEGGVDNHYFIKGWVSQHEPTIFAEQTGCVIKITCPDPWFRKRNGNASYSELQYSKIIDISSVYQNIAYTGDMEVGFIIDTRLNTEFSFYSAYNNKKLKLESELIRSGNGVDEVINSSSIILNPIKKPITDTSDKKCYLTIDTTNDNLRVYQTVRERITSGGNTTYIDTKYDSIGYLDTMSEENKKSIPKLLPQDGNLIQKVKLLYDNSGVWTNLTSGLYVYYDQLYRGI